MTRRGFRRLLFACALAWTSPTNADGAYGRLEGDVALQLDVGGGTSGNHGVVLGSVAARYLQTAGVYTTWASSPQQPKQRGSAALGVELRPLFLPRFLRNKQDGPATLDLAIDSLSLRLGAVTTYHSNLFEGTPGFETGLAFGIPLSTRATGFWIGSSGMMRWSHSAFETQSKPFLFWGLTLGWQTFFQPGIVNLRDKRAI